jgi:perosamine synthetase
MIPLNRPSITNEEIKNVNEVLKMGELAQGTWVDRFEEKCAEFLGVDRENIVAVSSGTAALHITGTILQHRLEHQIVHIPVTSFISTANTINYLPKEGDILIAFEDIQPDTWNMIPKDGYKITVDLFGNPNQYNYLRDVLIEDAAEAFGSEYSGGKCGTFGEFGIFSFFENKTITTGGEGGLLYAKKKEDANKARLLRQQGKDFTKQFHELIGYNYRMTDMQAAFGAAQLDRINTILERKKAIHLMYQLQLADIASFQREIGKMNPWMTVVKFSSRYKRDKVKNRLAENNIQTRLPFAPIYYNPPYAGSKPYTPVAEALYEGGLCLPNYYDLTDEQVKIICRLVKRAEEETKY